MGCAMVSVELLAIDAIFGFDIWNFASLSGVVTVKTLNLDSSS